MTKPYFSALSVALNDANIHYPTLVLDKALLDHNIDELNKTLQQGFDFRIVAKSLPSLPLLKYISERTDTNRFMSFHLPFLKHLVEHMPNADVLTGKPMPVSALASFYDWLPKRAPNFDATEQLQWLVDSEQRLKQYEALAVERNLCIKVNLEIDVGLHRGGFSNSDAGRAEFVRTLKHIEQSSYLVLGGLMGYEAHITKIPAIIGGPKKAFSDAQHTYTDFVNLIKSTLGASAVANLCLNTGGSSTYPLYQKPNVCTEIATASALVKPTDFDVLPLTKHQPAAYIAAPVLKKVDAPEIPMASGLSAWLRKIGLISNNACFIYGGNWLAKPCYPQGAKRSDILGHSSNQEMYELPKNSTLEMDDFMYFRPTQSEALFLQFGNLAVYDQGAIKEWWPVFDYSSES